MVNATELFVYKLRNMKDLKTFIDEVSAVLDTKTLLEIYHTATYSFLCVKLLLPPPGLSPTLPCPPLFLCSLFSMCNTWERASGSADVSHLQRDHEANNEL